MGISNPIVFEFNRPIQSLCPYKAGLFTQRDSQLFVIDGNFKHNRLLVQTVQLKPLCLYKAGLHTTKDHTIICHL